MLLTGSMDARGGSSWPRLALVLAFFALGAPGLASAQPAKAAPPCARRGELGTCPNEYPGRSRSSRRPRVQWFGLRAYLGTTMATYQDQISEYSVRYSQAVGLHVGGELVLFTLRWPHLYWEILRIGGGAHRYTPQVEPEDPFETASRLDNPGFRGEIFWGTALGYPIVLDTHGNDELRVGIHLTMLTGYLATYSGIQLLYQHQTRSGIRVQVGLMQTSFPFGVLLMMGFGI